MSNTRKSEYPQSPTAINPNVVANQPTGNSSSSSATATTNEDVTAIATGLQIASDATDGNALKTVIGLLANIASYDSSEKIDYDSSGKQNVTNNEYEIRYRSTQNLSKNNNIADAIAQQEQELKEAQKTKFDLSGIESSLQQTTTRILTNTQRMLKDRIFGPMWDNWTNGKDFIVEIKNVLGNVVNTFDPLLDLVDQLQEYIDKSNSSDGKQPLALVAIEALNAIIQYIRELIQNIEKLAEEYTVEEMNILLEKGTSGANWGTLVKTIQELIQLIIDCIRPYISNIVLALILDAIDMIVDKLDKAGILSPSGPLKLIPIAITLIRSVMSGNLEALQEMVKESVVKLINIVQLAGIALTDPSILWADTERMDKEIAVARYENISKGKDDLPETMLDLSAGARHYLQKMKNETQDMFGHISELADSYAYLNILRKKSVEENSAKQENQRLSLSKKQEAAQKMSNMQRGIENNAVEKPEKP